MGILNGKDIVDESITIDKLSQEIQKELVEHEKVVAADLTQEGASISRTFDGITATATNNGTFYKLEFTSEVEYENVLMVRTVYGASSAGSSAMVVTLGATPVSFPDLTTGTNSRIQITVSVPATNSIYHIHAFANANSDASIAWNNSSAYVEKM